MLSALGHKQNNTLVKTDNGSTAQFVSDTMKNKRSKSWDARHHWLTERQANGDL